MNKLQESIESYGWNIGETISDKADKQYYASKVVIYLNNGKPLKFITSRYEGDYLLALREIYKDVQNREEIFKCL